MTDFEKDVYEVVRQVPEGRVLTYGMVARLSGHPGAARAVGNAMMKCDDDTVPCHRIVNAAGGMARRFGFGGPLEQKRRLQSEDVDVINFTVNLSEYLWNYSEEC